MHRWQGRRIPASTRPSSTRMKLERSPFVVSVADLLRRPGHRRVLELRGPIGELTSAGTVVGADDEVDVTVGLEAIPEGVVADGELSSPWRAECRRCLQ